MNMVPARVKERLGNSAMESARWESSTLASAVEQKSKEALTLATSLSLGSVSASLGASGAATPETAEQKRKLDSAMCRVRWPKVIWSGVGLKENLSAGMASAAA